MNKRRIFVRLKIAKFTFQLVIERQSGQIVKDNLFDFLAII